MLRHPFCVHYDLETLTCKVSGSLPNPVHTCSLPTEIHEAISYAVIVIGEENHILFHEYYRKLDAVEQQMITLKSMSEILTKRMYVNKPPNQRVVHYDPDICHFHKNSFTKNDVNVSIIITLSGLLGVWHINSVI